MDDSLRVQKSSFGRGTLYNLFKSVLILPQLLLAPITLL